MHFPLKHSKRSLHYYLLSSFKCKIVSSIPNLTFLVRFYSQPYCPLKKNCFLPPEEKQRRRVIRNTLLKLHQNLNKSASTFNTSRFLSMLVLLATNWHHKLMKPLPWKCKIPFLISHGWPSKRKKQLALR